MTVVVYRDGIMAADSAVWGAGSLVICGHIQKIKRQRGALVACAGESGMIAAFHRWYEGGASGLRLKCEPADSFGALEVRVDGTVVRYGDSWLPFEMDAPYHVIGRGDAFVLGALAAGATAEEAVRLALAHTDAGGGDVQVERL